MKIISATSRRRSTACGSVSCSIAARTACFSTRADARRLGFDPAATYDHTYSTWGVMVSGASVRLRELRIGGFIARNVVAAIDDTPDDMRLLGASVLKLLHFELVNGSCVLKLVRWMEGGGISSLVGMLILLPFALLRDALRLVGRPAACGS